MTVSNRVSSSVATVTMLTFTAPPSRSSVAILQDLTQNSQHYLRNALSTQEIAHKDQYTSHLKEVSAKTSLVPGDSIAATLSWSIHYGATWFTFVLHRAPLALDTYMLVYFCILWHKLVTVWLLVPHGKYWHCVTSKSSGLQPSCFDVKQCQYSPCGTRNHTITNTYVYISEKFQR